MKAREERRPALGRRASGRRGMTPVMASVILVVAVGIVGALGYVVLNAVGLEKTNTSTTNSCAPSTAPECRTAGATHDASSRQLAAIGSSS